MNEYETSVCMECHTSIIAGYRCEACEKAIENEKLAKVWDEGYLAGLKDDDDPLLAINPYRK